MKLAISLRVLFFLAVPLTLFLFYVRTPHITHLPLKDTLQVALKASLQQQFSLLNSTLVGVASSDIKALRRAKCVLVGTSQPGYRYGKGWIESQLKRPDHVPFVHFTIGQLHNDLAPHYGRVLALISASNILSNAETLVYSDIDTILDFPKVCALHRKRSVVITFLNDVDLQTTWLVLRPHLKNSRRLLREWLSVGRAAKYQDQTVLQELYKGRKWVEDTIKAIWKDKTTGPRNLQFAHCSSTPPVQQRDRCFREKILKNLWPGPYHFDEPAGFRENFRKEWRTLHAPYASLQFSDITTIRGSECVLIRTSQVYSSPSNNPSHSIPFIDVKLPVPVPMTKPPSDYARLAALITASRVLPDVRTFVTTTTPLEDANPDYFHSLCQTQPNAAIVFPHPLRDGELSIRSRWFVARPGQKDGGRLLKTWLNRGKGKYGVEVLKGLCKRERWIRNIVKRTRAV